MPAATTASPSQSAPAQPAHRTRQATRKMIMNQYTNLFTTQPSAKGAFDEAAADLTAFLDFSSYGPADSIVVAEAPPAAGAFSNAFGVPGAPMGALRPVDDALLDSPLDLELSPASSFASSISGSPYDLAVSSADFTSPLLGSFESPLLESFSMAGEFPSLFAPTPGADFLASTSFAMQTEPQWAPQHAMALPALPQLGAALPTSSPMEDVKPVILASPPVPTRSESALFEAAAPAPAPASIAVTPAASELSASGKRKTVAQLRKEAAQAMPEQSFTKDKFTGVRNTKKPMIDYDAPTLPKNYLTESATSKKRGGSAKYASSVTKRARSTASATPGLETPLPETQPEPIDAENLDEEQLTAIEMKRRSNTLAARRSRARKAQHISELQDEIARLKAQNDALLAEVAAARAGCTCRAQV